MKKILIIEDDEAILEALHIVLEASGFHVETLPSGRTIFGTVKVFDPDIILLDLLLSGADGGDITKELKKNKKTAAIPVILMSAHPDVAVRKEKCGADAFLSKPFEVDALLETIRRLLRPA